MMENYFRNEINFTGENIHLKNELIADIER